MFTKGQMLAALAKASMCDNNCELLICTTASDLPANSSRSPAGVEYVGQDVDLGPDGPVRAEVIKIWV